MIKQLLIIPVLALGLLAGCGEKIDTSKNLKTSEDSFSYVYGYETAKRMKQQGIDALDWEVSCVESKRVSQRTVVWRLKRM